MSAPAGSNGGPLDMAWLAAHAEAVLDEPAPTTPPASHRRPTATAPAEGVPAEQVPQAGDARGLVPPPQDPMAVARILVAAHYRDAQTDLLHAWRGGFFRWDGHSWRELDEATIRSDAYRFLESAQYETMTSHGPEIRPWQPTRPKIANLIEALRAITHLAETVEPPAWLSGSGPDPTELLVTENGILHLPSRTLAPHDPRLFVTHAMPFGFERDAPQPARWQPRPWQGQGWRALGGDLRSRR